MSQFSRRSILKLGGLTVASASAGRTISKVNDAAVSPVMRPVAHADVTLLGGPMLEQFQSHHATLLAMDEDALLKPFRVTVGLSAPGEDLGG